MPVTLLAPLGASKVSGCILACAAVRVRLHCDQMCSRAGRWSDEAVHYFNADLYARELGFERVTSPPGPGVPLFS